jgi:hypothetical protein
VEITIRTAGANKFVIQMFLPWWLGKVMECGPWLFRDWAVIIAPCDGIFGPDSVSLEFMPVWIHIHKIPKLTTCLPQGGGGTTIG